MTGSGDSGSHAESMGNASAFFDEASWSNLNAETDPESFAGTWLDLFSRIVGADMVRGVVVMGAPDAGPFAPVAIWPKGMLGSPWLIQGVEKAVSQRDRIVERGKKSPTDQDPNRKLDVISAPTAGSVAVHGAESATSGTIEWHRLPEGWRPLSLRDFL